MHKQIKTLLFFTLFSGQFIWIHSVTSSTIRGTINTIMTGHHDPRFGDIVSSIPIYEILSMEITDLNIPGSDSARLVLNGYSRLQLGEERAFRTNNADLSIFYIETQKKSLSLRLGRQHISTGVGRMRMVDGLSIRSHLAYGIIAELYSGATVHPWLYHRVDNHISGARVSVRPSMNGELGLSYMQIRQRGAKREEFVGSDLYYSLGKNRLYAKANFNPSDQAFSEGRIALITHLPHHIHLTIDASRTSPELFLNENSIFSVFSNSEKDSFGGDIEWQPSPYYLLSLEGRGLIMEQAVLGYSVKMKAVTYREASKKSRIGIEGKIHREHDEGYISSRALAILQIQPQLRVMGDLYLYKFAHEINDVSNSILGQISAVYDISKNIRIASTVSGGVTPYASQQIEAMFRFAYGYDVDLSREVGP